MLRMSHPRRIGVDGWIAARSSGTVRGVSSYKTDILKHDCYMLYNGTLKLC